MIRTKGLLFLLLVCSACASPAARPLPARKPMMVQALPPIPLVMNNTRQEVVCSFKPTAGLWTPWFQIPPGANWKWVDRKITGTIECRPPVRAVEYEIKSGVRYSLLQALDGSVELVEITS